MAAVEKYININSNCPEKVARFLLNFGSNQRAHIRVFYGYTEHDSEHAHWAGRDWGEENDVVGILSWTRGPAITPMILATERSEYGNLILQDCVVRMQVRRSWGSVEEVYKHPKYTRREYKIAFSSEPGYAYDVLERWPGEGDGAWACTARFHSGISAGRWIAFMEGRRWRK